MKPILASELDEYLKSLKIIDDDYDENNNFRNGLFITNFAIPSFYFNISNNCKNILSVIDCPGLRTITVYLSKEIEEKLDINKKYLLSVYSEENNKLLFETALSINEIDETSFSYLYTCKRFSSAALYIDILINENYKNKYNGEHVYYNLKEV